jgi:hypothetical protein
MSCGIQLIIEVIDLSVKSTISLCYWSIHISISWRCCSNRSSMSLCCCSINVAWLLLYSMIVLAISCYKFLTSANISFINVFIFPSPVSSYALTNACNVTCIVFDSSGRGCMCGTSPITAPEPFFLFKRLEGSSGEISYED